MRSLIHTGSVIQDFPDPMADFILTHGKNKGSKTMMWTPILKKLKMELLGPYGA
jgi:hypothetical protein